MKKYTPGPWTVLNVVWPEKQFIVIGTSMGDVVDLDNPINRKILENAPQMYQVLRTIMAYAEAHGKVPIILDLALGVVLDVEGETDKKAG